MYLGLRTLSNHRLCSRLRNISTSTLVRCAPHKELSSLNIYEASSAMRKSGKDVPHCWAIYKRVTEKHTPDAVLMRSFLEACKKGNQTVSEAIDQILRDLEAFRVSPDRALVISILKACLSLPKNRLPDQFPSILQLLVHKPPHAVQSYTPLFSLETFN